MINLRQHENYNEVYSYATTSEEKLLLGIVEDTYIIPEETEFLTWENADETLEYLNIENYCGKFRVKLSAETSELLKIQYKKKENKYIFPQPENINAYFNKIKQNVINFKEFADLVSANLFKIPPKSVENLTPDFAGYTRNCLDPWQMIEVRENGILAPCCNIKGETWTFRTAENLNFYKPILQGNLKRGTLPIACRQCHIREKIHPDDFAKIIHNLEKINSRELKIQSVRIDVTGKCNLRCVYCAVTNPDYHGEDIEDVAFEEALKILANSSKTVSVLLNGHGETTFHPKWKEYAEAVIKLGYKPQITTNFAKNYSDIEIAVLANFHSIQISLDSDNEEMMMKIRKAVKPTKIFENIEKLRNFVQKSGVEMPEISFSVGIYDPSIWTLPQFMQKLVQIGANSVTFWNLVEYEHNHLTKNIFSLSEKEIQSAKIKFSEALKILKTNKINYEIAGGFLEDIQ